MGELEQPRGLERLNLKSRSSLSGLCVPFALTLHQPSPSSRATHERMTSVVQQHGTSRSEPLQLGFLSGGFLEPTLGRCALVVDHQLVVLLQVPFFHDIELILSQGQTA